jgi:acetyl esterase
VTNIFHATDDKTVPYANSVALRDKLVAGGNRCELVTFEGLGHSYYASTFGEEGKVADANTKVDVATFLTSLGFLGKAATK